MFNKIILVGNLTKDGELRYSQSGTGIYSNSIATSRKFTVNGEKKEEVCFVDITVFSKLSETCNQYLRKGSKILIEGRLNFEQWVDTNGGKRSKHSVVVETMQMLDSKDGGQSAQPQQQSPKQNQEYQYPQNYGSHTDYREPQRQMPSKDMLPSIDVDEETLPF